MIEILISSKTRIKLLLKFFLNSEVNAHLRGLEAEFDESSNAIRLELNKLETAGFLTSHLKGNKKLFGANKSHPLYNDLRSIILKQTGIDQIIERVINRIGNLEEVYLVGDLGKGKDSPIIDLIFVGDLDSKYLSELIKKAEAYINRKIRHIQFSMSDFTEKKDQILKDAYLLLWCVEKR